MDATQFAEGLRQIAEWYESHPDMHLPHLAQLDVFGETDTKERAAEIVRALGGHVEKAPLSAGSDLFEIARSFNGVRLRFVFARATVCERRVVGVKEHPQRHLDAWTEEIVEWDCKPILEEAK